MFWVGLGAAVGVMAARKAGRAAEKFTPAGMTDGLAHSLNNLGDAIREFGQDVRDAMWDREEELRDVLGLNDPALDDPGPASARADRGF